MKQILSLSFLILVLAAASGCSKEGNAAEAAGSGEAAVAGQGAADLGPRGDVANGEAVYKRTCAACHQADGQGMNGTLAANFVKDKTRLAKPDSELFKSISEGVQGKVGAMPAQKALLSEQEIKDVIAYVRKQFGS